MQTVKTTEGLSSSEVEQSRKKHGTNSFTKQKRQNFFVQYLASFGDPIIKILLAALIINIIVMFRHQNWFETIGIAVAVFLATFVSTLSEYGSESAFIRLQEEASKIQCRVKRKEGLAVLPIAELVVGDMVLLQAGEKIPADGILVAGELFVDQSSINGESKEALKKPNTAALHLNACQPSDWNPSDKGQLFRGCVVTSGEGIFKICRVGDSTLYGSLARELQDETVESPMKIRLAALAGAISKLGYTAAAFIAFADLFNSIVLDNAYRLPAILLELKSLPQMSANLMHAALLAISIVVVAVPEGLPMMITVVLSSNMLRMQKDHVMVRKLMGIETAGSINILFSDKTGTLTAGNLSVSKLVAGDGTEYTELASLQKNNELLRLTSLSCTYNNQADFADGRAIGGNSTERALLHFSTFLLPHPGKYHKIASRPFDSSLKYSWEKIGGEKTLILIKGAPEKLLPLCQGYYDSNGQIISGIPPKIYHTLKSMTEDAMRVLLLATADREPEQAGCGLTLIVLAGIRDKLRPEVPQAVQKVREAGIQTVMITGDNKETAVAIAKEAGLLSHHEDLVLTSSELASKSDAALSAILPKIRVIARALPTDKSRLVKISQEQNLVVGMTGDGINDAPALKKADVGFAMGSGTEVAKEAGDIVILDNNFSSIAKAILYGRTIFHSIRKFIVFQLTMNLCAVGVSLIAPFLGIDTPVTVMQMLWINIIMDTLAGLAFAGESPRRQYMQELPKSRHEPILTKDMLQQILITGSYTILLCIGFLSGSRFRTLFHYKESFLSFMTAFFTLFIFCGIWNAFNARTHYPNLLKDIRKNPAFLCIMSIVFCTQIFLIYYGGEIFRTTPLSLQEIFYLFVLSFSVIPFDIFRKCILSLKP